FLAGSQDACCRLDRLELGDFHRYRQQPRQAYDLCRALAARGVLHARWQRSLGWGPWRGLHRRSRWHKLCGENPHPVPLRTGMTIFPPDGVYEYVCPSFTPEAVFVTSQNHEIVGRVQQASPFCPNIAAAPDGDQVWMTLKDVGKTMVFAAKPPFQVLRVL